MKTIRTWMIALAAFVTRMPADAFKEEMALTAYELEAEGHTGWNFLEVYIEALNRYAEETLRVERAPEIYRQMLNDSQSLDELARLAVAGFSSLGTASSEATKAFQDLARATKHIDFGNLEDLI